MIKIQIQYPLEYYNNYITANEIDYNVSSNAEDIMSDDEELTFSEMLLQEKETERIKNQDIIHNEIERDE